VICESTAVEENKSNQASRWDLVGLQSGEVLPYTANFRETPNTLLYIRTSKF